MLYILGATILVALAFLLMMWKVRSRMEFLLVTNHRDFLRELKIDGAHKLSYPSHIAYENARFADFSIEADGSTKKYSSVFANEFLLAKLGSPELIRLSRRHKNLRLALLTTVIFALVLLVGWP